MKMLLTFLTLLTLNTKALTIDGALIKDAPKVFKRIRGEFIRCPETVYFDYMPKNLYPSVTMAQTHELTDGKYLIEFNPNFKKMTEEEQYLLIVHELGHVKGLDHSEDENDIMYYGFRKNVNFKNYKVACFNASK